MRRRRRYGYLGGGGAGGANGYKRAITFDNTQAGGADSSNFPALISGTYNYLADTNNGGKVISGNSGNDIQFFGDSALTQRLPWEPITWINTSGQFSAWVQIPTLTHSSAAVIYMTYGNPNYNTNQSNQHGTWDSFASIVHHLDNGSVLSVADSTSNGNNGINSGSATAVAGLVNGGMGVTGANYDQITISTTGLNAVRFGGWFNVNSIGVSEGIMSWASTSADSSPTILLNHSGATLQLYFNGAYVDTTKSITASSWNKFDLTLNRVSNTITWITYLNGTQSQTGIYVGVIASASKIFVGSGYPNGMTGSLDEFRLDASTSAGTRSAAWIQAEYNNIKNSNFYSVGAEQFA